MVEITRSPQGILSKLQMTVWRYRKETLKDEKPMIWCKIIGYTIHLTECTICENKCNQFITLQKYLTKYNLKNNKKGGK